MTLKERREALGVSSQTDMALRCRVAQGTISAAERGLVAPKVDTLIRLAKGYRMTMSEFAEALHASRDAQREVA